MNRKPVVLVDAALAGVYNNKKINSQGQLIIPEKLRKIYLIRQQKQKIEECLINYSVKDSTIILKEELAKGEGPNFTPIQTIGADGRITLPIKNTLVDLIGHIEYVEIIQL